MKETKLLNILKLFCLLLMVDILISANLVYARRIRPYGELKQAIMLLPKESRRLGEEVIKRLGIEEKDIVRTRLLCAEGDSSKGFVYFDYDFADAELEYDSYRGSDPLFQKRNFRYLRLGPLIFINYEAEGTSLEKIRKQLGEDFLREYGQNIIFYTNPTQWQPDVLDETYYPDIPLPFIDRTTLVVIAHMLKNGVEGKVVADIGAGNGILSIVALRLGAKKIVALESDPECIEKAEEVAYINGYVPGKDIIFFNHYIRPEDGESLGLPKDITDRIEVVISNTGPMYRELPLQIISSAGSWPSCQEVVITSYTYGSYGHTWLEMYKYKDLMGKNGFITTEHNLGFNLIIRTSNQVFVHAYVIYGKKP
ncbi:MAG: 50S ribosomal protein L11 methyltransferase [Candidatus Omnitrophica bacterium]|nr:50S ribosomal protein L11 methyltransferase [Candidatus Omnitrophota bacterium]